AFDLRQGRVPQETRPRREGPGSVGLPAVLDDDFVRSGRDCPVNLHPGVSLQGRRGCVLILRGPRSNVEGAAGAADAEGADQLRVIAVTQARTVVRVTGLQESSFVVR